MLTITTALPEDYRTASPDELAARIGVAKDALGGRLLILGHHYQKDEVMRWADARGDSFGLSRLAADRRDADFIVFCGVHFMAESADILTAPHQQVLLPDLAAGCSMADMADIDQVESAWSEIAEVTDVERVVPITYMNSTAALKAFVGRHGGAVCTSSNARRILEWALTEQPDRPAADKVLFFPDQHLGRNTALSMGFEAPSMVVWDPRRGLGGLEDVEVKQATFLLWKGHCSVHQRFRPEHVAAFREAHPGGLVVVHPECSHEVVAVADLVGSTDFIIRAIGATEPGSAIGVGTEIHLVKRLADEHPDRTVECLDPNVCPCTTMSRIDAPHLAWVLEELVEGRVRNQISVDDATAADARIALERMLSIS
ncbi:MAG TPA: quinolinate synthase NadA [Acidimicrobiales bacterium]|jgi:quinolinate synthase|nr:quinolinate synthase NadA [Acidimicrobiales bacterium]